MRRACSGTWSAAVLLALVAGGAVAQSYDEGWTHRAGGGEHAGVALLGEKPLDVVATYRLTIAPGEEVWQLLWTPHGPTGLVRLEVQPTFICQLFRISDLDAGRTERFGPTIPCPDGARLLAYDAPRDQLIVTLDGRASDPMVQAWDARSGEVKWTASPAVTAEPSGAQDQADWFVTDIALDEDRGIVYVPFGLEVVGRNRIQAIGLEDGATVWATSVPVSVFAPGVYIPPPVPPPDPNVTGVLASGAQGFVPSTITLTSDGIVVVGALAGSGSAVVWLNRDGRVVSGVSAQPEPGPSGNTVAPYSEHAASSGTLAAFVLGESLFVVDPVNQNPAPVPVQSREPLLGWLAGPAWSRDALLVPLHTTAVVYPAGDTASPRLWPGFEGSVIYHALIAPPADAYVIAWRLTLDGAVMDLLRIDLASARTIDRVPVPIPPQDLAISSVYMLPVGEGKLLVWSSAGTAVLFAEAPDALRPSIDLDNAYPAAGEALSLVARAPAAIRELTVAWGDGVLDRAQPDVPLAHAYEQPGRRVVRVVALYPDNRTGTAETIVHVGATPPAQLTLLQKAFAPERENLTFGVLGIAVTAVGGLVAYGSRLRRKSRLQTDIEELDRLRAKGRSEPAAAVRALAAYRQRIKEDLARGRLDDAQYTALSSEAVRILAALRLRLLGGLEGRMSPRFHHMLETALEDGVIAGDEVAALRAALDAEAHLQPADRARLMALLEGWRELDEAPATARRA